ncbi:hypothetical protein [Aquabacter cavernae]|uniref:hypothetical protein n=1 Tax=Aquabacter cavernae TaxID=2496029 RepID=UPI000F8F413D|nr:hypothetical protein [Aquabacter cavernae]
MPSALRIETAFSSPASFNSALSGSVVLADQLADLIAAYHQERAAMNAYPGEIPEGYPTPAFDRLDGEDDLPTPQSRESALAALRAALRENDEYLGAPMISNLLRAAATYFESVA